MRLTVLQANISMVTYNGRFNNLRPNDNFVFTVPTKIMIAAVICHRDYKNCLDKDSNTALTKCLRVNVFQYTSFC